MEKEFLEFITSRKIGSIPKDSPLKENCYLCNKMVGRKALTEEHVVPRIIFNPATTSNHIKLWACKDFIV